MTIQTMRPKPFQLTCPVPGDKSISHRAIMFGSLAEGVTEVDGFLPGEDCMSTIHCFRQLGVHIERLSETKIRIQGNGFSGLKEPMCTLDVGNSGTTIRLMMGILAGTPFFSTVIGDESIARRPMGRVVNPLRQMGANIDGRNDGQFTPISIRGGNLKGIDYQSPVASAQVKSALLLAGLQAEGVTTVREPYLSRNHTECLLPAFGIELTTKQNQVSIRGGQSLRAAHVRVPGDISSAAFLIAAALLVEGSEITIPNVGLNPTRTGLLDVLKQMNADVTIEPADTWCNEPVGQIICKYSQLKGVTIGGEMIPRLIDEIPILAVIATQANGETVIKNAEELKVKETNRIKTTVEELSKLGANIEETPDGMRIIGPTRLKGGVCHSHGDHRIGMALAIAGLASDEGVRLEGSEAIQISFPQFHEILQKICL